MGPSFVEGWIVEDLRSRLVVPGDSKELARKIKRVNAVVPPEHFLAQPLFQAMVSPAQWQRPAVGRSLSEAGLPLVIFYIPPPDMRRLGLNVVPAARDAAHQRADEPQMRRVLLARAPHTAALSQRR